METCSIQSWRVLWSSQLNPWVLVMGPCLLWTSRWRLQEWDEWFRLDHDSPIQVRSGVPITTRTALPLQGTPLSTASHLDLKIRFASTSSLLTLTTWFSSLKRNPREHLNHLQDSTRYPTVPLSQQVPLHPSAAWTAPTYPWPTTTTTLLKRKSPSLLLELSQYPTSANLQCLCLLPRLHSSTWSLSPKLSRWPLPHLPCQDRWRSAMISIRMISMPKRAWVPYYSGSPLSPKWRLRCQCLSQVWSSPWVMAWKKTHQQYNVRSSRDQKVRCSVLNIPVSES